MINLKNLGTLREALAKERVSAGTDATLDWLTYLISLLPIPGPSQAAAIANKVMNDRALSARFSEFVTQIAALDGRIQQVEGSLERLALIGQTVQASAAAQKQLADLLNGMAAQASEFIVETSDWSTQEIVRSAINADWVSISATDNSQNVLDGTTVTSQRTALTARRGSRNVIRDSSFKGDGGSVSMEGVHQQLGDVSFAGPSVTYQGPNSQTQMGDWVMGADANGNFAIGVRNDPEVTVVCPVCEAHLALRESQLNGLTSLTCPRCGNTRGTPR